MGHVAGSAAAQLELAEQNRSFRCLAGMDRFFFALIVFATTLLVGLFVWLFLMFAI
jgi:predicted aminopeptidase